MSDVFVGPRALQLFAFATALCSVLVACGGGNPPGGDASIDGSSSLDARVDGASAPADTFVRGDGVTAVDDRPSEPIDVMIMPGRCGLMVARKHSLVVLSDEIYDKLLFSGEHVPTATLSDDVALVTFNGLSKAYLAPGWRVGWLAIHTPKLLEEFAKAVQRLTDARLCGPGPFQYAIEPALTGPQDHIQTAITKLRSRRDLMVSRLRSLPGISVVEPQGAFYAMPSIDREWVGGDEAFVLELVRETGVLFVHGDGFGQRPGTRHFRVVFLPPEPVLTAAFDGLEKFLAAR